MSFDTVWKPGQEDRVPQMTIAKVEELLQAMSPLYDIVRLVNPSECFELTITRNGKLQYQKNCFSVWGRSSRCQNCISYNACVSHKKITKSEILDGQEYVINALPLEVIMETGETLSCTIEMVSHKPAETMEEPVRSSAEPEVSGVMADHLSEDLMAPVQRMEMLFYADANDMRGSISFAADGRCIYANQQAFRLFHVEQDLAMLGKVFKNWVQYDRVDHCAGHIWRQVFVHDNKDFTFVLQHLHLANRSGEVLGDYFSIRDCTRETSNYTTAQFNLRHDLLTRIYNMKGFSESLRARLNEEPEQEFDLIQVKIRGFDLITQLFGTNKCDQLLISVARYLATLHESHRALYGRIGRDNFILCLPHGALAEIPLEHRLKELSGNLMGRAYHVHYQVGIYEKLDSGYSLGQMLDRTTMAINSIEADDVYAEQRFRPDLLEVAVRERQILNDFDDALQMGEFRLFLQPQVGLDGKVRRAEALARWFHRDRGLLMPVEFIPILERSEDISRMDCYIWEQAARQLALWEKQGHGDFSLSVNVSPKDLYYGDVAGTFIGLAEKYKIDPRKLHLEITESTIIENFDLCNEVITKLREKGFSVGLDDFGSGYSSLNMLQNIQADELKLDMGFLQKLDRWDRGTQIIKLVTDLAKSLHMKVVAEGVETEEQARCLQELQCDYQQGFYYSKPIPVEEFEKKYLERTKQSGT